MASFSCFGSKIASLLQFKMHHGHLVSSLVVELKVFYTQCCFEALEIEKKSLR